MSSCGDDTECGVGTLFNDPSGRWTGRLERVESDCPEGRGTAITVEHDVDLFCGVSREADVRLHNEDGLQFTSISVSTFGRGSFEVINERSRQRITISYENFDGDLADVEQKIRNYRDGEIVCSELYRGQARRQ